MRSVSTSRAAWVPLPAPGGPTRIMRICADTTVARRREPPGGGRRLLDMTMTRSIGLAWFAIVAAACEDRGGSGGGGPGAVELAIHGGVTPVAGRWVAFHGVDGTLLEAVQ